MAVSINPHATISLAMARTLLIWLVLAATVGCSRRASPTVFVDPALAILVPADTFALAGVRMEQLTRTPFYTEWVMKQRVRAAEQFRKESGLDLANLWEILVAWHEKTPLVLVRGRFADQGREPKLELPGAQRFSHKGYTLIGDERYAVVFLNPTTAAAGATAELRSLIERRNTISGIPPMLQERIGKLSSDNQTWFAAQVPKITPEVPASAPPLLANTLRLARTVQFASGGLDLRRAFRAKVQMETASDAEAERIRGTIRGLLGIGRLGTPENRREMLTIYDGMQIEKGSSPIVTFSTDIPFELLAKVLPEIPAP